MIMTRILLIAFLSLVWAVGHAQQRPPRRPLTCQEQKTQALVKATVRTQQRDALENDLAAQTVAFIRLQNQVARLTKQLNDIKKASKEKETPEEETIEKEPTQ